MYVYTHTHLGHATGQHQGSRILALPFSAHAFRPQVLPVWFLVGNGVPLRVPLRVTVRVPLRVPLRVTVRVTVRVTIRV